jgi:hypothetical protein
MPWHDPTDYIFVFAGPRHGVAKNVTDCKSVPAGNQQSSITSTLIALEAKQSSRVVHPTGGLLRRCAPRNDGGFYRVPLWGKKKAPDKIQGLI